MIKEWPDLSRCDKCPKKLTKQKEALDCCDSVIDAVFEVQDFCKQCYAQGFCTYELDNKED